jgi:ABC-type antimicrobial peptide transport system permease subunit
LILLVVASLLAQTFLALTHARLGFEASNLSVIDVALPADGTSEQRVALYERVAAGIAAIPGVHSVAATTSPPLFSGSVVSLRTSSDVSQTPDRFSAQDVTTNLFETLDIPIVAGRPFDRRDSSSALPVVIVNEAAARRLFKSPHLALGRQVFIDRQTPREIVGVVGNTASVFFNTLEWQTNPVVYLPAAQAFSTITNPERRTFGLSVLVRSIRPVALADVRRAATAVNSQVAITAMDTATNAVAKATQQPRFRMMLLAWFSIASLLLTAVGVYGLVVQSVARRAREIGIRIALGARAALVMRVVVRGALTTAAVGALVGCASALALGNALTSVIYGVDARDPLSLLVCAAVLLGVSAVAALLPALRATRIDPIHVLRAD